VEVAEVNDMDVFMNLWDWIFGRGKYVPRDGTAHSSDRYGFWKDIWKLRKFLNLDIEHSGSVDIYDHFGCAPYNDNEIKQERRRSYRPLLQVLAATSSDDELRQHARLLLDAFDVADNESHLPEL
jgi:hypothetical protein